MQYCFVRWKLRAFNAFISPLGVLGYLGYIVLPSRHIFNVLCSLKGLCYIETTCGPLHSCTYDTAEDRCARRRN